MYASQNVTRGRGRRAVVLIFLNCFTVSAFQEATATNGLPRGEFGLLTFAEVDLKGGI
jgi:hypothetical protein